jgi:hypothetical protein
MALLEALAPCRERRTPGRTSRIALVVGCVLTGINEGDVLAEGKATALTGAKIAVNLVVPFVVSNLGVLAGARAGR